MFESNHPQVLHILQFMLQLPHHPLVTRSIMNIFGAYAECLRNASCTHELFVASIEYILKGTVMRFTTANQRALACQ